MAYEADLCPGCGWPRTYSMHPEAKHHWSSDDGTRCYACEATELRRAKVNPDTTRAPGAVYFAAKPDEGMTHAMSDPVLTFPTGIGASGAIYNHNH